MPSTFVWLVSPIGYARDAESLAPGRRECGEVMTDRVSIEVTSTHREAFYAAAIAGLHVLDGRERVPRRFGKDADARWASFKGALDEGDRIDLLLRDASETWGTAFSPADVFGLFGLAPDEPFGPDWPSLSASTVKRHLASAAQVTSARELGKLMGIDKRVVELPALAASTRLAVAGGAALVAVAEAFAKRQDLRWSDQVLAIATTPAHRQLAGLLAVFVGAASRTRLIRPETDMRAAIKAAGFVQLDVAVVSPDAEPECAELAQRAAGVA